MAHETFGGDPGHALGMVEHTFSPAILMPPANPTQKEPEGKNELTGEPWSLSPESVPSITSSG